MIREIEGIVPVFDKDEIINDLLWSPQFYDPRFKLRPAGPAPQGGVTIYADPSVDLQESDFGTLVSDDLTYEYDDRLEEPYNVGREVMLGAYATAKAEVGNDRSARFVEFALRVAFNDSDLWVGHIKSGVNHSNGRPFKIFGYRKEERPA